MKTEIKKDGDTMIISVEGRINHEANDPLKENLAAYADQDSVPKKIIFDFENLEFVGSSGITSFVQTLREFNRVSDNRPRYASVRSEFQKIIRAFDQEDGFDFYENIDSAKKSFSN